MNRARSISYIYALVPVLTGLTTVLPAVEITPDSFERVPREGPAEIVAPRIDQAPVIDGDLAEATWEQAAVVKSFWRAGSSELAEDQTIAWLGVVHSSAPGHVVLRQGGPRPLDAVVQGERQSGGCHDRGSRRPMSLPLSLP